MEPEPGTSFFINSRLPEWPGLTPESLEGEVGEKYWREGEVNLSSSVMLWPLEDELRGAERVEEPWDLKVVSCTTSSPESSRP